MYSILSYTVSHRFNHISWLVFPNIQTIHHPHTCESMNVEEEETSGRSSVQIRLRQLCSLEEYLVCEDMYIFTSVGVTRCEGFTVNEKDFASQVISRKQQLSGTVFGNSQFLDHFTSCSFGILRASLE